MYMVHIKGAHILIINKTYRLHHVLLIINKTYRLHHSNQTPTWLGVSFPPSELWIQLLLWSASNRSDLYELHYLSYAALHWSNGRISQWGREGVMSLNYIFQSDSFPNFWLLCLLQECSCLPGEWNDWMNLLQSCEGHRHLFRKGTCINNKNNSGWISVGADCLSHCQVLQRQMVIVF